MPFSTYTCAYRQWGHNPTPNLLWMVNFVWGWAFCKTLKTTAMPQRCWCQRQTGVLTMYEASNRLPQALKPNNLECPQRHLALKFKMTAWILTSYDEVWGMPVANLTWMHGSRWGTNAMNRCAQIRQSSRLGLPRGWDLWAFFENRWATHIP